MTNHSVSIVIPCKNEEASIGVLLDDLVKLTEINEIIVVNDGSTDGTQAILDNYPAVTSIQHKYSIGNGGSVKAGARKARSEYVLFMDADGQHQAKDIKTLVSAIQEGYQMVVGVRDNKSHASSWRRFANNLYNSIASYMTGQKIEDLTSGFRICNREKFLEFLQLLPNGFSYPTTITMAFFRSGYTVKYVPIEVLKREGKSHISIIKDGVKFLLIIFKTGTLYTPLKFFVPLSAVLFSSGLFYYIYTLIVFGRFTNMSLLLLVTSVFIFIFGLISEQITMLTYLNIKKHNDDESI